jgi:hypothetical protein
MICPGAKTCGIILCVHAKEHEHFNGCENGCFGNTGCVKEEKSVNREELQSRIG